MTKDPSQSEPQGLAAHEPVARRSALITGAGSGIGRAVARALHARGERVILCGRRAEVLAETLDASDQVAHAVADVADGVSFGAAITAAEDALGPVSTAVLSAALNTPGHFLDQSAEDFDAMTAANITGVANTLRQVLPGMLENRHGRVVVIGTLADTNPAPGAVGYSATKGALHALVRGVAGEIDSARYADVLINEMTPGPVVGRMADFGRQPEEVVPEILAMIDMPAGSASGGFFRNGKRIYPGESFKGTIRRNLRKFL